MKITKRTLQKLIKEELKQVLRETKGFYKMGRPGYEVYDKIYADAQAAGHDLGSKHLYQGKYDYSEVNQLRQEAFKSLFGTDSPSNEEILQVFPDAPVHPRTGQVQPTVEQILSKYSPELYDDHGGWRRDPEGKKPIEKVTLDKPLRKYRTIVPQYSDD